MAQRVTDVWIDPIERFVEAFRTTIGECPDVSAVSIHLDETTIGFKFTFCNRMRCSQEYPVATVRVCHDHTEAGVLCAWETIGLAAETRRKERFG